MHQGAAQIEEKHLSKNLDPAQVLHTYPPFMDPAVLGADLQNNELVKGEGVGDHPCPLKHRSGRE